MRGDDSVGELREDGPHAVLEQGPDLPRGPGQHDDAHAAALKIAAGGGAPVVAQRRGALGQPDLLEIVRRELRVAALFEHAAQPGLLLRVELQLHAEGLGQRGLGEVVAGGAQAAGGDDEVGAVLGAAHRLYDAARVVTHDRLPVHVDAVLGEEHRDVRRVRVYRAAEQ